MTNQSSTGITRKYERDGVNFYTTVNFVEDKPSNVHIKSKPDTPEQEYLTIACLLINRLLDSDISWDEIKTMLMYHRSKKSGDFLVVHHLVLSVSEICDGYSRRSI